jgi:hypothetical protein
MLVSLLMQTQVDMMHSMSMTAGIAKNDDALGRHQVRFVFLVNYCMIYDY